MTGPRGSVIAPECAVLGARRPRKDEIKPKPAAPAPAPGIDPGKFIEVDSQGRLTTNDPRNEAANRPPDIALPCAESGWRIETGPSGWIVIRPVGATADQAKWPFPTGNLGF